jgi:hypothetical protein
MAVATAERIETYIEPVSSERYANSRAKLRAVGAAAVRNEVELCEIVEYHQAKADFKSSLREMIVTDPEFCKVLDIDDERGHEIIDGTARDIDGTAMIDLIKAGHNQSKAQAEGDKRYQGQADRDGGDVYTAEKADGLLVGRSWLAVSMTPRQDLQEYPEIYDDEFGYGKNLIYIQSYSKESESELVAASHSLYITDENILHDVLAEFDINIPEGESHNNWIRHGLELAANGEEAEELILDIREAYYKRIGLAGTRHSVTEFVGARESKTNMYFDAYYPALGQAINSKTNHEHLQGLAKELLKTDLSNMDPKLKTQLIKIANTTRFDDELGDAMEAIVRYAVVEDLRQDLQAQVKTGRAIPAAEASSNDFATSINEQAVLPIEFLNQRMATNIQRGMRESRSYGGCANRVKLNGEAADGLGEIGEDVPVGEKQKAFGGKGCRSIKNGMKTTCPHCKQKVQTIVEKEGGDVRCSNKKCAKAAASYLIERVIKPKETEKSHNFALAA